MDDCCLSNHVFKYAALFHKPPQFVRNLTKKYYYNGKICGQSVRRCDLSSTRYQSDGKDRFIGPF